MGERVLDIGCGPGFLCESMADIVGRDGAVIGVDISSDLVALSKRRSPPKWLSYGVGDATQLVQPDASFDAVVVSEVRARVGALIFALLTKKRVRFDQSEPSIRSTSTARVPC